MNAREVLETMVRTDRGNMTVWSPTEVRNALDAYRAAVLREAADVADGIAQADAQCGNSAGSRAAQAVARKLRGTADEHVSQAEKPRATNGMDPRLILGIAPDWPYPNRS